MVLGLSKNTQKNSHTNFLETNITEQKEPGNKKIKGKKYIATSVYKIIARLHFFHYTTQLWEAHLCVATVHIMNINKQ